MLLCKFPAYNDRLRSWFKLKERSARDWKIRSTKVDAGDFKHELLNRLRSTMAVNVYGSSRCNTSQSTFLDEQRNHLKSCERCAMYSPEWWVYVSDGREYKAPLCVRTCTGQFASSVHKLSKCLTFLLWAHYGLMGGFECMLYRGLVLMCMWTAALCTAQCCICFMRC